MSIDIDFGLCARVVLDKLASNKSQTIKEARNEIELHQDDNYRPPSFGRLCSCFIKSSFIRLLLVRSPALEFESVPVFVLD